MSDVIGDLLPSAFAVALSPIAIIAVVLVLGARRARTAGPAFALGWIAGLLAVSVIVVLVLGAGGDPNSDDPGISWLKVATTIGEDTHADGRALLLRLSAWHLWLEHDDERTG